MTASPALLRPRRPTPASWVAAAVAALLPTAAFAAIDIAVVSVNAPEDATTGSTVSLLATIKNAGSEPVSEWELGLYLSPDNAVSVFDRRLAVIAGPALAPGELVELPMSTTLPGDVALGTYTFGVIADPMNTLGEPVSTMLDNVRAASRRTQVKAPSPDFVAVAVEWPARAAAGESTPVRFTVENRGVLAGEALVVFHLSTNDNITAADPQVGQQRVALEAGVREDIVAWVRLPPGIAASRYHLGIIIDPQNELAELQEGNNVAVSAQGEVVAASLVIESSFLHDALVGTPYVRGLVAAGGDGPYVWRLVGGTLPEGMRLSEDGIVTGTATTPGVFSPVVEVASGGRAVRAAFILRAYVPTTSLSVLTEELPPAVAQATYEAPLAAVGGTPPYTWKLSAGTLPSGLELLPDGRITGKARSASANPAAFTAEVKDASGATYRRALSLKTLAAGDLAIRQLVLDDAAAGEAYLARIEPSGGARPYRWAIATGQLPAGLAIASEGDNLTVAGRPLTTGMFVFSLRVEDATGQADRNTYALRVGPSALEIRSTILPDADRGQPYDAELTATTSSATWRMLSGELPTGMELTSDGHVRAIDGTVPQHAPTRTFTFSVEVTDGKGGVGRTGLSLTIRKVVDDTTDEGGCAGASGSWLALLVLAALVATRRRIALVGALLVVAPAVQAQGFEYFVVSEPETYASPACTHRCSAGNLWLDNVSLKLPDETELVANGAFETTTDDLAVSPGWVQEYDSGVPLSDEVTCTYQATGGAEGTKGLKCKFPTQHVANADSVKLVTAPFDLAEGVEHALSFCARGDVDGQELVARVVDATGAAIGTEQRVVVQNGTYGCFSSTVTSELAVTNARLELLLGDASALTGPLTFVGGLFGTPTDDGEASVVLPFEFPFFDSSHRIANVSTNGYLTFVSSATAYSGQDFPSSASPNGVIAPWWEDLTMAAPAQVRWFVLGTAPHRSFVIEWKDAAALGATTARFTFQARLEEEGTFSLAYDNAGTASLGPASVGAESDSGHSGVNALPCRDACGTSDFPSQRRLKFTRQIELLVTSLSSPELAYAGLPGSFDVIVQNQGALPAEVVRTRVYLSRDTRLDPETDPLLLEHGPVALEPGHEVVISERNLVLPADLGEGRWYPLAVVDPDDEVDEAVETNNVKVGDPIRIGPPAPNFVATSVSFTGTQGTAGDEIPFVLRIGNVGNRPGLAPWRVVLSRNDVVTVSDRTAADGAVQLAPGASEEITGTFVIPADLVSGTYRVGLVVDAPEDARSQVPELNEFDNTARADGSLTISGPLSMLTTTLPDGAAGIAYSVRLHAAGGNGLVDWVVKEGSGLPQGLALSSSGTLEGIPLYTGSTTFTVAVTSGAETIERELSLYVAPISLPLSFVSTQLPAAIFGREYETRLSAHGGVPPYLFRLATGAAVDWPQGVSFDGSGLIGGVPSEGGDWELPFVVEDRQGNTATRTLVLHVLPPGRPVIDARPLEDALLDEAYTAQLTAVGGRPPYRWTVEKVRRLGSAAEGTVDLDTTLPGLSMVAEGRITGTPTELGLYALSMLVTDAGGAVDRDTVLLEVRSELGLAVLTGQLPDATRNRDYEEQVVATGGSGQLTFSLFDETQVLPEGLVMRPDGLVLGRPTAVGRKTILVRVVDAARRSDVRAVTIEVKSGSSREDEETCSSVGLTAFGLLGLLALLRRRKAIAGLALAAGLTACGAESPPPPTLCDDVSCLPGEECDLSDGICKCGGVQGRACTPEESCNAETLSCELLDRCKLVQCTRGMSCDRADGACKCGIEQCEEGEMCDAATLRCVTQDRCALVSCAGGTSCDPADGTCKCGGSGGKVCGAGEVCRSKICKADLCASVACTGGTTCDPEDGRCRCGGAGGELCLYGQTCLPDAGRCITSSRCASVRCSGGSSCDPADGTCKCGGAGGPTCETGQTCEPDTKRCIGGNRCRGVTCSLGGVCDPEDGLCHCGTGGPVCGEDEACEALSSGAGSCKLLCEPVSQTPCSAEQTCALVSGGAAICTTPGTKGEGAACSATNECGRGMHCVRGISSGACRYYCAAQDGLCSGTNRACRTFSGAPTGVFACQPCLATDVNCNH